MDVSGVVSSGACDRFSRNNLKLKTKTACRCDDSCTTARSLRVFWRVRVTRQARLGGDFTPSTFEFQRPARLTIFPLRSAACIFWVRYHLFAERCLRYRSISSSIINLKHRLCYSCDSGYNLPDREASHQVPCWHDVGRVWSRRRSLCWGSASP